MIGHVLFTTIDARDPEALAAFWAEVLGTEVDPSEWDGGRFVFLHPVDGQLLCFQRVPEDKTAKNRVHLDIGVRDLDEATRAVVALGGAWDGREHELEPFRWRTVTDPEGNEFDIALTGE